MKPKNTKINILITGSLLSIISTSFVQADTLGASYANVPPSYEVLSPSKQIGDARVDFDAVDINMVNGYQVTDSYGNTFYVDDIDEPDCAFYATYVEQGDGFGGGDIEVDSSVYIEELNLEGCK